MSAIPAYASSPPIHPPSVESAASASSSADSLSPSTPTASTTRPDSFSIHVRSGEFKSIRPPLDWEDIPPLAVLTGVNGSGKTQLLQALAMHYGVIPRAGRNATIGLSIYGMDYKSHDVLFLEDFSRPLGSIVTSIARLEEQITSYRSSEHSDFFDRRVSDVIKQLQPEVDPATIFQYLYYNPKATERAFAHHCTAYLLNCANALLAAGADVAGVDLRARFGLPPWEELNSLLEDADFDYRVQPLRAT
jgi:hypothetical protein